MIIHTYVRTRPQASSRAHSTLLLENLVLFGDDIVLALCLLQMGSHKEQLHVKPYTKSLEYLVETSTVSFRIKVGIQRALQLRSPLLYIFAAAVMHGFGRIICYIHLWASRTDIAGIKIS